MCFHVVHYVQVDATSYIAVPLLGQSFSNCTSFVSNIDVSRAGQESGSSHTQSLHVVKIICTTDTSCVCRIMEDNVFWSESISEEVA